MNIFGVRRIIIVGNNGSGKSYLSKELAAITGLPLVHLDMEFWRLNWQMPPHEEWIQRQSELIARERWIIEGNHTGTMELRFAAADAVIFLDINRLVCLAGVLLRRGRKRSDLPHYLNEKLDHGFLALCRGMWRFPKDRKPKILGLHAQYPGKPFLTIGSRRAMKRLLQQWSDEKQASLPNR